MLCFNFSDPTLNIISNCARHLYFPVEAGEGGVRAVIHSAAS